MKKGIIIIVIFIISLIFSSCEYKEIMNYSEIEELYSSMRGFVADDDNFTNYFKHSADNEFLRVEDVEKNELINKYQLVSNEVDQFFESGIMYTNNKVSNKKTKTTFRFEEISFVSNIYSELAKIKLFIKDEYINEITGSVFPTESYKIINIRINTDILLSDGLTSQKYSKVTIYAEFDMNGILKNVGIIYRDMNDNVTYYETGPKLNAKIEFNEDFSKYE